MTKAIEAWMAEEQRQASELAHIIQQAIETNGKALQAAGRQPLINAVAGALVTVEAGMLASITDPRFRKSLRQAMERARPHALALAVEHGVQISPQVVVVGGPKN